MKEDMANWQEVKGDEDICLGLPLVDDAALIEESYIYRDMGTYWLLEFPEI